LGEQLAASSTLESTSVGDTEERKSFEENPSGDPTDAHKFRESVPPPASLK